MEHSGRTISRNTQDSAYLKNHRGKAGQLTMVVVTPSGKLGKYFPRGAYQLLKSAYRPYQTVNMGFAMI